MSLGKKTIYVAEYDAVVDPYLKKIQDMQAKTEKALDRIGASAKKFGTAFLTYLGGREMLNIANDAVQLAVKMEGVNGAFKRLKGSQIILNQLRSATKGTVSDLQLMQASVKASNFKMPLDLLAKGLEFANLRAMQTGESVDYMVDSFITGVARKSLPILDNLGISQSELNDEVKRTGDFYLAIGKIVERENAKMNTSIDLTTIKQSQLKAQIENHEAAIASKLLPLYGELLSAGSSILSDWTVLFKLFDQNAFAIAKMTKEMEKFKQLQGFIVSPHKSNPYAKYITNTYSYKGTNDNNAPGNSVPKIITGGRAGDLPSTSMLNRPDREFIPAPMWQKSMISNFKMDEVPIKLKDDFEEIGTSFVDKFGEINNIASQFGNILGISADSFVGKLISGIDTASQLLNLVASIASFAGGGPITSLFGLAEGGTVINKNGRLSYTPIPKFAHGGSYVVPPGYANDSGLIRVQSGERVDVTPANQMPMLSKLLASIDGKLGAANINNSRKNSQPILVSVNMDGEKVASLVYGYGNNFDKRGVDKTMLRGAKGE